MHAVIDSLHTYLDKLLYSPHHLMAYIAGAAVLLVCIPLMRVLLGSRSRGDDESPVGTAYPSMLGLGSRATEFEAAPIDRRPAPSTNPLPSKVTAINESLTVHCIHCDVIMPSREDFCPACGYAQPVKESLSAAFPA